MIDTQDLTYDHAQGKWYDASGKPIIWAMGLEPDPPAPWWVDGEPSGGAPRAPILDELVVEDLRLITRCLNHRYVFIMKVSPIRKRLYGKLSGRRWI